MSEREILRRMLWSVSYRTEAALKGASEGFASFAAAEGARTPGEILGHITHLLLWTCEVVGQQRPASDAAGADASPLERFRFAVRHLDGILAHADLAGANLEMAVQGPLADSLAHAGQIALLRRVAGEAMEPHNYARADMRLDRPVSEAP